MQSGSNASLTKDDKISAAEFRALAALFPSGVTIITRRLPDGRAHGMTVSSFTSVSLDPPLILVCIDTGARFTEQISRGLPFIVNVLAEDQEDLARRFADKREDDRFAGVNWMPGWSGLPLLRGTVASFGCSLDRIVEAGDHLVLIGAVHELRQYEGRALVWCERGYHCLPRPD
jgi:flavin reductase (DIM6/NTAB) family NADH-FMN oxidoreductase RutF